jgi:hypothetical protein
MGKSWGRETRQEMMANDYLYARLMNVDDEFSSINTWSLGMVKLLCKFAEAYCRDCGAVWERPSDEANPSARVKQK